MVPVVRHASIALQDDWSWSRHGLRGGVPEYTRGLKQE